MRKVVPIVLLVAALAAGCGGTQPLVPGDGGSSDSTDATDPNDAALDGDGAIGCDPSLTYANFGMAFLDTYCFRCHGFDQQSAQTAGSSIVGAAGTGTFMPPVDPRPSDRERQQLTAWIACGAP